MNHLFQKIADSSGDSYKELPFVQEGRHELIQITAAKNFVSQKDGADIAIVEVVILKSNNEEVRGKEQKFMWKFDSDQDTKAGIIKSLCMAAYNVPAKDVDLDLVTASFTQTSDKDAKPGALVGQCIACTATPAVSKKGNEYCKYFYEPVDPALLEQVPELRKSFDLPSEIA